MQVNRKYKDALCTGQKTTEPIRARVRIWTYIRFRK